ncbi:hypothetical protein [Paracraurococcus lichenis]|uniref:Uncharacterized protein n=1 Tax=Paracraurococcus lichenis TaxID=3064888 RepID=A0ABT9EC03_9PROT|nr:hypothetical protein [Paracraurococcus sp. LOR1-02]MDO9713639.1 hypothetical protein [Paracraurococcus sp. LOR1-02]
MRRPSCVILTVAHPTDRSLTTTARLSPPAFVAAHPELAAASRRVLRTGTTECHPGPDGASLYIARGLA